MSLSSFLHIVKWFQVLYNSDNLTSVIYLHTVCFIWPIDRTKWGKTTPSGPGSNGNEELFNIPQSSNAGALTSDSIMLYKDTRCEVLSLCRDAIGVFYSPHLRQ